MDVVRPSIIPERKLSSGAKQRHISVSGYVAVGLLVLNLLITMFGVYQWPGYNEFRRQVQIRDETPAKNPITVAKFAHHVGRSVEAFFRVSLLVLTRDMCLYE
jgi:hypothetical protein